ncbi:MAG: hypothetical protein JNM17_03510 [Archangium sp.]|nr:hypothetical protein [Archangium sp.]
MIRRVLLCSAVLVVGCVKRVPTIPPETVVTVGSKSAPARNWASVEGLCDVDRNKFGNEQQAMTALLADWLGQTSAEADGAWDDEHLALLENGLKALSTPMAWQRDSLAKAKACGFEGLGSATELNAQALRRIDEGPWLAEQVRARLALAKWKDARPQLEHAAKQQHCLKANKPPVLYFAAEDEKAVLEWAFCDGSRVVASPGNPPAFQPAKVEAVAGKKSKAKEPDPQLWLDAASKYPSEHVSRAPKLPRKKVVKNDDAPEPEDAP